MSLCHVHNQVWQFQCIWLSSDIRTVFKWYNVCQLHMCGEQYKSYWYEWCWFVWDSIQLNITGDEITIRLMETTLKNLENSLKKPLENPENCCEFLVATLWLIHHEKLTYVNTVFEKYCFWKTCLIRKYIHSDMVLSMMKYHNLFSNPWTNWSYARSGFTKNI